MDWIQILVNTASSIISPVTIAYALAAIGLVVHFGFTGLLNMGIAGLHGDRRLRLRDLDPHVRVPVVGRRARRHRRGAVFALILGIPTLRLRGDYLAIVTIAAAEVVRLLFLTSAFDAVTGSADGLSGYKTSFRDANPIPPGTYGFGPWVYNEVGWWVRIVGFLALAIALFAVWRSCEPVGPRAQGHPRRRGCRARPRQERLLLQAAGAHPRWRDRGAGGIIYALDRNVNPGVYVTSLTFFIYTALLLGGAATIFGPILGSVIFWVVQTFLGNVLPALAAVRHPAVHDRRSRRRRCASSSSESC